MSITKILAKLGLVKITEYDYHNYHVLSYQMEQERKRGRSSRDDPYMPRPLLTRPYLRSVDEVMNWNYGNRGNTE